MILDTTFFIDLLNNVPAAVQKTNELEQQGSVLATTSIVAFELWRGFGKLSDTKKQQASTIFNMFKVYPLDFGSAKRAGKEAQILDSAGQMIDPEDIMSAGIALENNESILTRNIKHFSRIKGLVVEGY